MQDETTYGSPRNVPSALFSHNSLEAFQGLFQHVGLDHDANTILHVMKFLSLYHCFKPINEGVFNASNPNLLNTPINF